MAVDKKKVAENELMKKQCEDFKRFAERRQDLKEGKSKAEK